MCQVSLEGLVDSSASLPAGWGAQGESEEASLEVQAVGPLVDQAVGPLVDQAVGPLVDLEVGHPVDPEGDCWSGTPGIRNGICRLSSNVVIVCSCH